MDIANNATMLRIFVGEDKRHGDRPLYEAIALKAREQRLAGATVLSGRLGFGHSTRLHTARVTFSADLPVMIEIVDSEERINRFVALLEGIPEIALMTVETVKVVSRPQRDARV
ncbi:MAG: DUF190 domain-containing protein [Stellaceae bacterium]